jgi:hypothetical protein
MVDEPEATTTRTTAEKRVRLVAPAQIGQRDADIGVHRFEEDA